jgi:hypothetical protein
MLLSSPTAASVATAVTAAVAIAFVAAVAAAVSLSASSSPHHCRPHLRSSSLAPTSALPPASRSAACRHRLRVATPLGAVVLAVAAARHIVRFHCRRCCSRARRMALVSLLGFAARRRLRPLPPSPSSSPCSPPSMPSRPPSLVALVVARSLVAACVAFARPSSSLSSSSLLASIYRRRTPRTQPSAAAVSA